MGSIPGRTRFPLADDEISRGTRSEDVAIGGPRSPGDTLGIAASGRTPNGGRAGFDLVFLGTGDDPGVGDAVGTADQGLGGVGDDRSIGDGSSMPGKSRGAGARLPGEVGVDGLSGDAVTTDDTAACRNDVCRVGTATNGCTAPRTGPRRRPGLRRHALRRGRRRHSDRRLLDRLRRRLRRRPSRRGRGPRRTPR